MQEFQLLETVRRWEGEGTLDDCQKLSEDSWKTVGHCQKTVGDCPRLLWIVRELLTPGIKGLSTLALLLLCPPVCQPLDNGLARTPPMGWLSWERFRCNVDCKDNPRDCISEFLVKSVANEMVHDGFLAAGYRYIVLDDCWPAKLRDRYGRLQPDKERFPAGMKALADYVHSLGFKFGIYEDVGDHTCKGYPGSRGHYKQDALTIALWGVDYLKFDGCGITKEHLQKGYTEMGQELNKTGHPVLYSCEWPLAAHNKHGKVNMSLVQKTCNSWRVARDVQDNWQSVLRIINVVGENQEAFQQYSGPGSWMDADQLVLGDFGLSPDQERVQMGMWAIMGSPMLISADVRDLRDEAKELLLNPRVIAISQDPLGLPGRRVLLMEEEKVQVWTRPVEPAGSYAIAIIYTTNPGYPIKVKVRLRDMGLKSSHYNLTEVFDGKQMGMIGADDFLTVYVNPTGIFLVKATQVHDFMMTEYYQFTP